MIILVNIVRFSFLILSGFAFVNGETAIAILNLLLVLIVTEENRSLRRESGGS